jgi:hypothetical protein
MVFLNIVVLELDEIVLKDLRTKASFAMDFVTKTIKARNCKKRLV